MKKKNKSNESVGLVIKQMMSGNVPAITMDDAADLLKDNPDMLKLFEKVYAEKLKEKESNSIPYTDSKQMTDIINKHKNDGDKQSDEEHIQRFVDLITEDLVKLTSTFQFDGNLQSDDCIKTTQIAIENGSEISRVAREDFDILPKELRPQLTANAVIKDIPGITGMLLLSHYKEAVEKAGTKEGLLEYHRFRQGLDIMDLDDLSYVMMDQNRNSMGHWLPQLIRASIGQNYFNIPKTTIAKLPITLLQLTKLEYSSINKTTRKILNSWTQQVFNLTDGDYFIKTGTYSSKFDFRNVRVNDPKEIAELGEYLLYIHGFANQFAGPLFNPCIYGMSTTTEWVVRDFIKSKEDAPTIYNGLPLHVEYRVFIDCDTHEILSIHPYWDPNGMKNHFSKYAKGGNINHIHDYIVFKSFEDKMIKKYEVNKNIILENLQPIVDKLDLTGQWSLDIMDDGEKLWLIDMAVAEQSTFYESIPEEKRRPVLEVWIPGTKPVIPPWFNSKTIELSTSKTEITDGSESQK